jgi:hypothetical protein
MDEKIIRSVSLYFYLNLFDPRLAFSASQKTLARFRDLESNSNIDLIKIARKILTHAKGPKVFGPGADAGEFTIPKELNLKAWKSFKQISDSAEFEAVLWSRVLGFSDEDVAAGLDVTEGTIRHRVGRGLRELGQML